MLSRESRCVGGGARPRGAAATYVCGDPVHTPSPRWAKGGKRSFQETTFGPSLTRPRTLLCNKSSLARSHASARHRIALSFRAQSSVESDRRHLKTKDPTQAKHVPHGYDRRTGSHGVGARAARQQTRRPKVGRDVDGSRPERGLDRPWTRRLDARAVVGRACLSPLRRGDAAAKTSSKERSRGREADRPRQAAVPPDLAGGCSEGFRWPACHRGDDVDCPSRWLACHRGDDVDGPSRWLACHRGDDVDGPSRS